MNLKPYIDQLNYTPTQEQVAFWRFLADTDKSAVVEARAGTGKTTILLTGVDILRDRRKKGCVVAFNKSIATEIQQKLEANGVDWRDCNGATVHAIGFRVLKRAWGITRDSIDNKKVMGLVDDLYPAPSKDNGYVGHPMAKYAEPIIKLVELAKQRAIGVRTRIEDEKEWYKLIEHFDVFNGDTIPQADDVIKAAQHVLQINNDTSVTVDFSDLIYQPLIHGLRPFPLDYVMVDEAQDTNEARRMLVRMMVKPGGRVIAVGDRHQAIYGFTGADSDSLDLIQRDFDAEVLTLTTSFRCPKAVIRHANQWVENIYSPDDADEGEVIEATEESFLSGLGYLSAGQVGLCRNNAPLVEIAYDMIRKRIPVYIEGRDIAEGLKGLCQRWKIKTTSALLDKLDAYFERESAKLLAKGKEDRIQALEDKVDVIRQIIGAVNKEGKSQISDVVEFIDSIFKDTKPGKKPECFVLSSIHKSKGREWNTVYWLYPELCPSQYARQEWQLQQEDNLCYVATTRAKSTLILVEGERAEKPKKPMPDHAIEDSSDWQGANWGDNL